VTHVKVLRQKPLGKLQLLHIPGRRWEWISMDIITDLPCTSNGNNAVCVVAGLLGPSKVVHAVGSLGLACNTEVPQIVHNMHPMFHVSALRT
jgi:hypothetical protein